MKYLVEYDDITGNIQDTTGMLLVIAPIGFAIKAFDKPEKTSDIDKLIKLKGAGFTAEEIIMLLVSNDE